MQLQDVSFKQVAAAVASMLSGSSASQKVVTQRQASCYRYTVLSVDVAKIPAFLKLTMGPIDVPDSLSIFQPQQRGPSFRSVGLALDLTPSTSTSAFITYLRS